MDVVYAATSIGYIRWIVNRPIKYWRMTIIGTVNGQGLIEVAFSRNPFSRSYDKRCPFKVHWETGEVTLREPSGREIKRATEGEYAGLYVVPKEAIQQVVGAR